MQATVPAKDWATKYATKDWVSGVKDDIVLKMVDAVKNGPVDDRYDVIVFTLASGAHGSNQWKAIADYFDWDGDEDGVKDEEVQWIIEDLDKYAGAVAAQAGIHLQEFGLDGAFWFGNNEVDGDYELFYGECVGDMGPSRAVCDYLMEHDKQLHDKYVDAEQEQFERWSYEDSERFEDAEADQRLMSESEYPKPQY